MPTKADEEDDGLESRLEKEQRLREKRTEFESLKVKIVAWDVQRPINYVKKVLEGFMDFWDQEMLKKK